MASLNPMQQEAWSSAYRSAQDAGLSEGEASDAASKWAKDTNFGQNPPPISYELGPERPQRASSDIEEKIAAAAHKYDPTLTTEIFSGQENPLGVGQMNRAQRAMYNRLLAEGYPGETAGRMIRAQIQKNSLGRHPLGQASDARFLDMAGERLPENKKSQEIADQIAFNFVQSTGGNWGRGGNGYMSLGSAHLDTAPLGQYAPRPHWGDTTKGSRFLYGQAKALHDLGLTDPSMLPFPTGRGVSRSDYVANTLDANTEPEFHNQYAPGGTGLLGADPISPQAPLEYFGPPAPRSDYPTGPLNPEPWQDSFAPAPAYPSRTASRERFEKTFARPDPDAPALLPGTSNRARAVAYRGLADSMTQAGMAGLDGRPVAPAPTQGDGPRPVPIPTARPEPTGQQTILPPLPGEPLFGPTPSTIPVPTPAPRRGAGLFPRHRHLPSKAGGAAGVDLSQDAIGQFGSPYSGPRKQIFDFVLRKLLNPTRGPN